MGAQSPLQEAVLARPHALSRPVVTDVSWSCHRTTTVDGGSRPCPTDGLRQGHLQSKACTFPSLLRLQS